MMYSIGEISKIVNISKDTLRYYDEIGLLKPDSVNQENGYRYYNDMQVEQLLLILEYKSYGFSLSDIKSMMDNDFADIREILEIQGNHIGKQLDEWIMITERIKKKKRSLRMEDKCTEKTKVLMVDDSEFMLMMLEDIISKLEYQCIPTESPKEALELIETHHPDMILMDIEMPEGNGLDCTKEIIEKNPEAIIIMLSAHITPENLVKSIELGAKDIVVKPFHPECLLDKMNKVLTVKVVHDIEKVKEAVKAINQTEVLSQSEVDQVLRLY